MDNSTLLQNLKHNLLGQIKVNLCEEITQQKDVIPSRSQVSKYFSEIPRNSRFLLWFYHLWMGRESFELNNKVPFLIPIDRILAFLEQFPIRGSRFFSVDSALVNGLNGIGVLFFCEKLAVGGYVYSFLIVDKAFPKSRLGIVEIRASALDPNPFMVEISQTGEEITIEANEFISSEYFQLIYCILNHYYFNPVGSQYIPLSSFDPKNIHYKFSREKIAPKDQKYDKILRKALTNRIGCTRALIEAKDIIFHSLKFANSIPDSDILEEVSKQRRTHVLGPLVYWNFLKGKFIVSDDYQTHLAQIYLKTTPVPAVIMGKFPKELVQIIETGKSELIPGVSISPKPKDQGRSHSLLLKRLSNLELIDYHQQEQSNFLSAHSEIWIGSNTITYGLFIAPLFINGTWENAPFDKETLQFVPWTIGHVLAVGLVAPKNNHILRISDLDQFLDFYITALIQCTGSTYQYDFAKKYVEFVRKSNNPHLIPFLIPEYRYLGKQKKHQYRLDFAIIHFKKTIRLGIELSPWSTHGTLKGTKEMNHQKINEQAKLNREVEFKKALDYFRKYNIQINTYTDEELKDIDKVFWDAEKYFNPSFESLTDALKFSGYT